MVIFVYILTHRLRFYNLGTIQSGIKTIVIKSIRLLKALARGNDVVQKRIYDRMDTLLKVRVVESEIALALKEVCNSVIRDL